MPEQRICSFTNEEIEPGTGMMYVKRDGSVYWFRDSKSRKNMLKLKRNARRLKWTRRYEKGGIKCSRKSLFLVLPPERILRIRFPRTIRLVGLSVLMLPTVISRSKCQGTTISKLALLTSMFHSLGIIEGDRRVRSFRRQCTCTATEEKKIGQAAN